MEAAWLKVGVAVEEWLNMQTYKKGGVVKIDRCKLKFQLPQAEKEIKGELVKYN